MECTCFRASRESDVSNCVYRPGDGEARGGDVRARSQAHAAVSARWANRLLDKVGGRRRYWLYPRCGEVPGQFAFACMVGGWQAGDLRKSGLHASSTESASL